MTGVVLTGLGVLSAFGRGPGPLMDAVLPGTAGFGPVTRFDVAARLVGRAAALPGALDPVAELLAAIDAACAQASFPQDGPGDVFEDVFGDEPDRASCPVLLAVHADGRTAGLVRQVTAAVAARPGLSGVRRVYTCACVAGSTAVADAAAMIEAGGAQRVVVAAAYLVEPDTFAVFDAGRALSRDGLARPFSRNRQGLLLGDAVVAVVLESTGSARRRGVRPLARLAGWGRAGDGYHVCRPRPDGAGLARAIGNALDRAGISPGAVDYVNANATGSPIADQAEAAALDLVFGAGSRNVPVSSTKGSHGHALEASALLEFVVTVLALRAGRLPVNAGYLGSDGQCDLDLVLDRPREVGAEYALTLNSAFGGGNTALLVGAS